MRSDPERLLVAWERGATAPVVGRGAAVVAAAGLVPGDEAVLDLPLGTCAALATRVHRDSFDPLVACAAACSGCGELVDLVLDLRDLPGADEPGTTTITTIAGTPVTVRALTTRDLIDAGAAEDPRAVLLDRCVAAAEGVAAELDEAAESALEEAAERLAGAAATVLRAVCPGCGTEVRVGLDPGVLLWDQVVTAAQRVLDDVAELAAVYGWSEGDVLRLSPMRRAAYLERARW